MKFLVTKRRILVRGFGEFRDIFGWDRGNGNRKIEILDIIV